MWFICDDFVEKKIVDKNVAPIYLTCTVHLFITSRNECANVNLLFVDKSFHPYTYPFWRQNKQ